MNSLIHISHKGKGKGPRAQREKGKRGASNNELHFHPTFTARSHARDETISRLRGGLPKGELTPPNLRCIYVYVYVYLYIYIYIYVNMYDTIYHVALFDIIIIIVYVSYPIH